MRQATEVEKQAQSGQRGAILVESAFVLPILALIFLCIVDLGFAVREHQVLQNAAREGARIASLPPGASLSEIQSIVQRYCFEEHISVDANSITLTPILIPLGGGVNAQAKQVTVSYTKQMLLLGASILPSANITLRGTAIFRNLY